jgi:hypothetical protein
MECVLFGDHPRHEWSHTGRFQPALDEAHIGAIKAKYDLCIQRFGYLQTETLESWHSPAPGVQETVFSDGTRIRVDFASRQLWVNDEPVRQPGGLA